MFIRRFYYDLQTGEHIYAYHQLGAVWVPSVAEDFAVQEPLQGRTADDTGVFEWLEPDEETEAKFNGGYNVSADVSAEPHVPVFRSRYGEV